MKNAKDKPIAVQAMSPVEQVLADAQAADEVVCVTISKDGDIEVLTSIEYMPDVLWTLELARAQVLDTSTDEPEQ